jgi:hypothetical protein
MRRSAASPFIANNGPLSTSHEQTLEKLIREQEKLEQQLKRQQAFNSYL